MEGYIPAIIRQHPPQYFHVPELGISEGDDLFFFMSFSEELQIFYAKNQLFNPNNIKFFMPKSIV